MFEVFLSDVDGKEEVLGTCASFTQAKEWVMTFLRDERKIRSEALRKRDWEGLLAAEAAGQASGSTTAIRCGEGAFIDIRKISPLPGYTLKEYRGYIKQMSNLREKIYNDPEHHWLGFEGNILSTLQDGHWVSIGDRGDKVELEIMAQEGLCVLTYLGYAQFCRITPSGLKLFLFGQSPEGKKQMEKRFSKVFGGSHEEV